jgi:cyclic pyranopterin phosphate synthase
MIPLVDPSGRRHSKLRISLTDACNQSPSLLRPSEYRSICGRLVAMGIDSLRVTGGEPTVRPEFRAILAALADLPAIRKGVTSNGQSLERHLPFLRDTGWDRLNVSLDSLDPGTYHRITGGGDFRKVVRSIEKAVAMGFPVKVNMVAMRGINDGEIRDFAGWAAGTGVEVRFLELMRIGPQASSHGSRFLPADSILQTLAEDGPLVPLPAPHDSTARLYATARGARLGVIASESRPFCASCSRLRLSATGVLRCCLMSEDGISLREAAPEDFTIRVRQALATKPPLRPARLEQPMHAIGG